METLTEKYIDAVNNADLAGLIALFEPTATLSQKGRLYEGTDQIADFYRELWLPGPSAHEVERQFVDGNAVIVQFKAVSPTGEIRHAVDVFIVKGNLFESLEIYYR
ncbi:nuclear transport factor 2 family protein [Mycolicibacterium sediminis]|nr:nuclear transport factor 2 family protein [Mycolicibacterium sediminis]